MSTLDAAGNSNGEIPVHCWKLANEYPWDGKEPHNEYVNRLIELYKKNYDHNR
jgi:hypothetical protein